MTHFDAPADPETLLRVAHTGLVALRDCDGLNRLKSAAPEDEAIDGAIEGLPGVIELIGNSVAICDRLKPGDTIPTVLSEHLEEAKLFVDELVIEDVETLREEGKLTVGRLFQAMLDEE